MNRVRSPGNRARWQRGSCELVDAADPRAFPLYCSAAERIILIRGRYFNLNLRELHDSIFGEPQGGIVRFYIVDRALILSRSTRLPALRTGPWPAMALTLILENKGRIQGKGGAGGRGGQSQAEGNAGAPGGMGGDGFLAERAITIINAEGQIWGGGGGGGGAGGEGSGGAGYPASPNGGGGGGGGAGTNGGAAGEGGSAQFTPGLAGAAGTADAGGVGGDYGATSGWAGFGLLGGTGGGPGLAGAAGATITSSEASLPGPGGAGGAPGRYIVQNHLVTWTSVGDVRGSVA